LSGGTSEARTKPSQMMRAGEQGTGVSTGISMRTLAGRKQLPGGAGFFSLLPLEATGE